MDDLLFLYNKSIFPCNCPDNSTAEIVGIEAKEQKYLPHIMSGMKGYTRKRNEKRPGSHSSTWATTG